MANKIVNLVDGDDKIFPKIPCILYDANTDRRVEQNRADAIQHIRDTADLKNGNVHAIVRYSGGYYFGYIFIMALPVYIPHYVLEILPAPEVTVNIWSGVGSQQVELIRTI